MLQTLGLQLRTARHVVRRRPLSVSRLVTPSDERLVFVVGSPRSGTTFLAGAIGSVPGFIDLGEVAALKAAIPALARRPVPEASGEIRRILDVTRRLGLTGGLRGVEQTPETAYVAEAALVAYPRARVVHIVRDGRDVVCSLLERGWLNQGRAGADDAGLSYGAQARFWVERGREEEFGRADDARRCAWAWRRYVSAARQVGDRAVEVRYEQVASDPAAAARHLAAALDAPEGPLADALGRMHDRSIGRHRTDLTPEQLRAVEGECGELLEVLGYR